MGHFLERLTMLYEKLEAALSFTEGMKERDAGLTYFTVLRNEVAACILEVRIHKFFLENHRQELEAVVGKPEQVKNYFFTFIQHINEAIVGTFIFQTELLFRVYYGTANGVFPSEGNILPKVAYLFDDIENNWKKEECKLMVLVWAIRNTIHTGGIFFKEDCIREYRGIKFELRYGMPIDLSSVGDWFEVLAAMTHAILALVRSDRIRGLGFVEHPNYKAVGK